MSKANMLGCCKISIKGEPSTNNFSLNETDAFAHISKHP